MNQSPQSDSPWISAVLVNWNRCRLLKKAIQSLLDQHYANLELIVVDNGSTDDSLPWLREQRSIRLIENTKNVGAAAARNQGTRIARGKYILYMDSDAELRTEGALQRLIDTLEADPNTAGIAGIYFTDESLTQLWCWSPCMDWEGYFDPVASMQPKTDPPVLSTCFSIFRHSALQEIGGFDEFFFYLYEDGDLSDRLWKRGYRLRVDPDVKILHHYAQPGRTLRDQLDFHYYTERLRMNFLIKNWGIRRYFRSCFHKIRNYRQLRNQFPYLSFWHYWNIYGIRAIGFFFRYLFLVRYRRKGDM